MLVGLLQKLLWSHYILLQSGNVFLFYYIWYPFLFVTLSCTTLKLQLSKSPAFLDLHGMTMPWLGVF